MNIMTSQNEKTVDVLNDVVEILNDRIEGYERATKDVEMEDLDLKAMFAKFISDSRSYKSEIVQHIGTLGGDTERGTTFTGQIHKAWMDLKSALTGKDRVAVLESCKFGDEAAIDTYRKALENSELPANVREVLNTQMNSISQSHSALSTYLDANKVLR
jgi:uncharacterized protein (TIGR02284 family)